MNASQTLLKTVIQALQTAQSQPNSQKKKYLQIAWQAGNEFEQTDLKLLPEYDQTYVSQANHNLKKAIRNTGRVSIATLITKYVRFAKLITLDTTEEEIPVQITNLADMQNLKQTAMDYLMDKYGTVSNQFRVISTGAEFDPETGNGLLHLQFVNDTDPQVAAFNHDFNIKNK